MNFWKTLFSSQRLHQPLTLARELAQTQPSSPELAQSPSHKQPNADIVFSVTTKETSCRIDCHGLRASAICDFMERIGFTFGARYDYGETNLVERTVNFADIRNNSYVSEFWKCPIIYRGDNVGYATFSNDGRVDVVTIGTIEIVGHQLNTEAAQRLVKDIVHSFEALQAHLRNGRNAQ